MTAEEALNIKPDGVKKKKLVSLSDIYQRVKENRWKEKKEREKRGGLGGRWKGKKERKNVYIYNHPPSFSEKNEVLR